MMKNILLYVAIACAAICLCLSNNISEFMFTSLVISIVYSWYHLCWKKSMSTDEERLNIIIFMSIPLALTPTVQNSVGWSILISVLFLLAIINMAFEKEYKVVINS